MKALSQRKEIQWLLHWIPAYAHGPLTLMFLYNLFVFVIGRKIVENHYHYNMTTTLDTLIPVVPWTAVIYFGCYLFWLVNYILATHFGKEHFYRIFTANIIGKTVCLICFLLLPTTIVRPEITGTGLFHDMMRFLYWVDTPDGLFPSIHCFASWFCFIAVRGQKKCPLWYRIFSCIFALMVFLSTLTTKQHVIADVVSAVLLVELCYYLTNFWYYRKNHLES